MLTLVVGIRIPFAEHKNVLPPQGRTDCHVAALLATATYHDSLNSRLVPLGAMTVVFCTLPCLLSIGNSPKSGDPSVTADAVPAPLKGAPRGCGATNVPVANLRREALPLLGEVPSAHTGERGRRAPSITIWQKKGRSKNQPPYRPFSISYSSASPRSAMPRTASRRSTP